MFKKSIIIVAIQLIGSFLGIVSIYFIAGSMDPKVYSLTGVYTIVAGITMTFSDLGIETTMMREALFWKEKNDYDRIKEYASQAIQSRLAAFFILIPLLMIYVFVLHMVKYESHYLGLLCLFVVGGAINALNNSMTIMVRSLGDYIFAQAVSVTNNYIIKFAGLGIYFWRGANAYLWFYGISSIPLFVVYLVKIKGYIKFSHMNFKAMLKKIYLGRYLWLKTDLEYFKNNADGLLVSTLFPPDIMGAYTIYKQLEQLSKSVIEGFFDVLSQNTVRFKGNEKELVVQENKIKKARDFMLVAIAAFLVIFAFKPHFFIELIHLEQYQYLDIMIICLGVVSVFHVLGKFEINAVAFFGSSKTNFILSILIFILSVISYMIVMAYPTVLGVLSQRMIIFAVTSFLSICVFVRQKKDLYTKVLD